MATHRLPDSWSGRLRWVLGESTLVAAVFAFWVVLVAVLTVVLGVFARVLGSVPVAELRFAHEVLTRLDVLWAAVIPLAVATTTLYVLVRAGTILVDRFQQTDSQ